MVDYTKEQQQYLNDEWPHRDEYYELLAKAQSAFKRGLIGEDQYRQLVEEQLGPPPQAPQRERRPSGLVNRAIGAFNPDARDLPMFGVGPMTAEEEMEAIARRNEWGGMPQVYKRWPRASEEAARGVPGTYMPPAIWTQDIKPEDKNLGGPMVPVGPGRQEQVQQELLRRRRGEGPPIHFLYDPWRGGPAD
jgi:hypothetical protein